MTDPLAEVLARLQPVLSALDEIRPWYHVSPQQIAVGACIVPGGGPSPWGRFYEHIGEPERTQWVWVEPDDPRRVSGWRAHDNDGPHYVYRVRPEQPPQPHISGCGYITTAAVVIERLDGDTPWEHFAPPQTSRMEAVRKALHPDL